MKKFAKMSLVAAVAVAGLTSTASAGSLEEAIKGVDVSGQFRYRFQEKKVDGVNSNKTGSDVEIEVTAKIPVNDMVTAIIKVDNANDDKDDAPGNKGSVNIEDYYFQYVNGALTVNAGQQNIPGRLTDGAEGDGLVALYSMGAFTVGAAAFANHDVDVSAIGYDGSQSLLSVIAMGNVGPVSLLGQYATVDDTLDAYNLKADAKFGPAMVGLEYSAIDLDNETGVASAAKMKEVHLKAYVSAKVAMISAKLTYAQTGDNGSGTIDNQTTKETETPGEYLLWNIGTATRADADIWAIDASAKVSDKVTVRAAFLDGEEGDKDLQEVLGQVSYKMSKNLNTYIRYAEFEEGNVDGQRGRIEVKYSF